MSDFYKVEAIVNKKIANGEPLYRIKWVGYPSWQNTWEPPHHLPQDIIDAYENSLKEAK